jgi:tetratricopeptide (TPR) repeat protein
MGEKRTRTGKYIHFFIAGLILLSFFGCAFKGKGRDRTEVAKEPETVTAREEVKEISEVQKHLLLGRRLLAQGDFEGSLRENQKVLSLAMGKSPGDDALYHLGLVYAHPGNPKRDYEKSIGFFNRLVKEYPGSPLTEQAKTWAGILQENEKLREVIEKSKQVDIEIEEKKRGRAK